MTPRRCVYTAMTGDYESLSVQPAALNSSIPFICFTDNPSVSSNTWQMRPLKPIFPGDTIRSQRRPKILVHQFLTDFDQSIYIDNTIILRMSPEEIFETVDLSSGMCLPLHSGRQFLWEEFHAVSEAKLDDPARIAEQSDHYKTFFPEIMEQRPFWNAILVRDHRNPAVTEAMDIWYSQVLRYSRRDQLSVNVAFHMAGLKPAALEIDNQLSQLHSWISHSDRRYEMRFWNGAAKAQAPLPETKQEVDMRVEIFSSVKEETGGSSDNMAAAQVQRKEQETLGYNAIGGGGINNQKMALIGLFVSAFETKSALSIPYITMMDQVNRDYRNLDFDSVFNLKAFLDVAAKYGIPVVPFEAAKLPNGYDKYFWKTYSIFEEGLFAARADKQELTNLLLDLLGSFNPKVKHSYLLAKLAEDIYERHGVTVAGQFRIEVDWQRHCNGSLKAHIKEPEDNYLPPEMIVRKIFNVFPETKKILALCDEPALPTSKDDIRRVVQSTYGIELLFKSDFLTDFDSNLLRPTHLSLIDFELALRAPVFVGLSRSTFSNLVTLQSYAMNRRDVDNHYIYNTTSPMIIQRRDNGCYVEAARAVGLA